MNKKWMVIILASMLVGGFFLLDRWKASNPHYEVIAHRITKETAKILNEKYHLRAIGIGGGMMDDIKLMSLSLKPQEEEFTLEEARRLIVSCIDIYLDKINTNEKVRPFLHNYPFTIENIHLSILMGRTRNGEVLQGKLAAVSTYRGKISYSIVKSEYQNKTFLEETYEEAKAIVMAEREGMACS